MFDEASIRSRFRLLASVMDERTRRLWAAAEARILGHGGITAVSRATGISRVTITAGLGELDSAPSHPRLGSTRPRIRRVGGGRKFRTAEDPGLESALEALIEPTTRGDPESPLRWTCKSLRKLATELEAQAHPASPQTVGDLLRRLGYSLQANVKTREGSNHPDRNAQFEHINARTQAYLQSGQPAISVDTKKKELVGDFKNAGREWLPKGQPEEVRTHDFIDRELGKVIPYGVYDVAGNEGWVNVGTDHDTPAFAVASIRRWWMRMGRGAYPKASKLLVMADAGGSNGYRSRAWKSELQELADTIGVRIEVCHFPPGTSKWNKIEHRMFCHITQNWRGRPLVTEDVVVQLIGATTTRAGLTVRAAIDKRKYRTGVKVPDSEIQSLRLRRNEFHGDWNYSLIPRRGAAIRTPS